MEQETECSGFSEVVIGKEGLRKQILRKGESWQSFPRGRRLVRHLQNSVRQQLNSHPERCLDSYKPIVLQSCRGAGASSTFIEELDTCRKSKGVVKKNWHPGCTALVALTVRNTLLVANAGDCRNFLCRAGKPVALSKEHVASLLEERERVIGTGGEVRWLVDTLRVGPVALQVTHYRR